MYIITTCNHWLHRHVAFSSRLFEVHMPYHHNKTIRWELLLRYQLIEIMALWEGRVITNHLTGAFGIGRQQASKDINAYIALYPANLEYDKKAKGYVPSSNFNAAFTQGNASEYLHLLNSNKALSSVFETTIMPTSYTKVLSVPNRNISPHTLRPIIKACREKLRLDITYCSMNSPEGEDRIIAPHSLVFSGVRWHVRAFCEKHRDYRDFVINRIKSVDDMMGQSIEDHQNDHLWHQDVQIEVCPNPNLNNAQQALIARDYDMSNGILNISERASLIQYTLAQLQVFTGNIKPTTSEHLVLNNRQALVDFIKADD